MFVAYAFLALGGGLAGCALLWPFGPIIALLNAPVFASGTVLVTAAVVVKSRRRAVPVAVPNPLAQT